LRSGIIRNVPHDISEGEIINSFSSQLKIISARRLNIRLRKDGEITFTPSKTVLVKFHGQYLPRSVTYMYINFSVSPYFPRVLMCFSCFRYGHINADCKSKPRCDRCGGAKHSEPDVCPRLNLPPICCNCGGEHLPSAVSCPAYLRQKQIYTCATLDNISYAEARLKLSGSPSSLSPSPNPFHPSEFPSPSQPRNPPRPLINYQDLTSEVPVSPSPTPGSVPLNAGISYAAVASLPTTTPSMNRFNSSPSNEHPVRVNTYAPRNYQNLSSINSKKPSDRNAPKNFNSLRDVHNSLLFAPNGRMPYSDSPLDYNSTSGITPGTYPPSSSFSPPTDNHDGPSNFLLIISFVLKILNSFPSTVLTALFSTDTQYISDSLQNFLTHNAAYNAY
ncbi:hypothetical protein ALC62_15363, partial [Cyphomyrmex costatus]